MNEEWCVNIELLSHQKASIYKMERLERERVVENRNTKNSTMVGILGDKVGSGKTLTMVSYLSRAKSNYEPDIINNNNIVIKKTERIVNKIFEQVDLNNEYFTKMKKFIKSFYFLDINLIVVSPLTLRHWEKELSSSSNLKCLYIYREIDITMYDETYDVIVIVHNRYNSFINYISMLYKDYIDRTSNCGQLFIRRLILDEIIYFPNMLKIEANFFWIITPRYNICNIYTESQMMRCFLKRLLASINISSIVIRNTIEQYNYSYQLPAVNELYYECFSLFSNLNSQFFSEEVRKMIAADDLQSAIDHLGGHLIENNNLQTIILQKETDILTRYEEKIKYYSELDDETKIEYYNKKYEQKVNNINNLKSRIDNLSNECPVCMETIEDVKIVVGCCTNVFCENCILEILKSSSKCALCRKFLNPSNMIYSKVNTKVCNNKGVKKKTKIRQLLEIIQSNLNKKYVVFSEYNNTFDIIYEEMIKNNISATEIKGTVDRINKILHQFQNGFVNVLLLNSRNDGSGINLQDCTDIIIYHKMEKSLEEQIIGRAYRIGRTSELNIHRLLHSDE